MLDFFTANELYAPLKMVLATPFQIIQLIVMLVLMVIQIAIKLLTKKNPPPRDEGRVRVTGIDSIAPKQVVYGHTQAFGSVVFKEVSRDNRLLNVVVVFACHECHQFNAIKFNDQFVSFPPEALNTPTLTDVHTLPGDFYSGYTSIETRLGRPGQTAFQSLVAEGIGWDDYHTLDGHTAIYFRLGWNQDKYQGGEPNYSVIMDGKLVENPVLEVTGWSNNAALVIRDYLKNTEFGRSASSAEINQDVNEASIAICFESVAKVDGGLEQRYSIDGTFRTDRQPIDILGAMAGAMAGSISFIGGQWYIIAGAWYPPTVSFDENDYRSFPKLQTLTSARDAFSAVKGTFISEAKNYAPDDYPAVVSPALDVLNGGERVFAELNLEFTQSPSAAQRIARIFLLRAWQELAAQASFKLGAWICIPSDVTSHSLAVLGWAAKPFEIMDMSVGTKESNSEGSSALEIDMTIKETAASVYVWDTSMEIYVDTAPNTTLPSTFNVIPASNLVATERKEATRDASGVKIFVDLTWTASPDGFVTSGGSYYIEWKLVDATEWNQGARVNVTHYTLDDQAPGRYNYRVRSINVVGVTSDEAGDPTITKEIVGLMDRPAAPTGLTAQTLGGQVYLSWAPTVDLDVRIGGTWVLKHSATDADWATAVSIGDELSGYLNSVFLPSRSGFYLIKARDSMGQYSDSFASVSVSQVHLLTFTNAHAEIFENPMFLGVKDGVAVDGGELQLSSQGDWDSVVEVDALPSWDYTDGGVRSEGVYYHNTVADLGSVKTVRVTPYIAVRVSDIYDNFDARPGDVDDWLSWDGNVTGNEGDAIIYMSTCQIAPGAAVEGDWSPYQRCDATEARARGLRWKTILKSRDGSFNVRVPTLSMKIEEPV